MEVANASMYDGSTATTEAAMMAVRLTGRRSVVVASSLHPEFREVLAFYAHHQGLPLAKAPPFTVSGRLDMTALEEMITTETASFSSSRRISSAQLKTLPASPTSLRQARRRLVVSIAEAVSLGIVEPPRQADVIAMEAQSFGVPLGFGGPYCGVIATGRRSTARPRDDWSGRRPTRNGKRGLC